MDWQINRRGAEQHMKRLITETAQLEAYHLSLQTACSALVIA